MRKSGKFGVGPVQVRLEGRRLYVDDVPIDFSGKRNLLKLISSFLESPGYCLNRDALVTRLEAPLASLSPVTSRVSGKEHSWSRRLYTAKSHNAVKTLSRARLFLEERLKFLGFGHIEWFAYCQRRESWHLYRVNYDVLLDTVQGRFPLLIA